MKKTSRTTATRRAAQSRTAITDGVTTEQALQEALDDMSIVRELNVAVARGDSLPGILSIFSQQTKRAFHSHGAAVYLLSPNKKHLTLLTTPSIENILKKLKSFLKIRFPDIITVILHEDSIYQSILDCGKPGIIDDEQAITRMIQEFSTDPLLDKIVPKIYKFLQIKSVLVMPLIVDNEPIGIMDMSRKEPFSRHDLKRFEFLAQGIVPILSLRKSQRAYDEGRELFTQFVHSADEGFIFCDGNLNVTEVNDYLLTRFNVDKNDVIGMNIVDFNLGALDAGRYDAYLKVLQTGQPVTFDKVPTPPEFGDRYVNIKACRIGDNLILIVNDITEQYREEQELRESETEMRSIIENQTDLICRFTPDKILTFVNSAYCDYFGKTKWELIGTNFLSLIKEEDRHYISMEIDKLNRDNPVNRLEEQVILPDGAVRWQQWINRAVFDETGAIIEYQSVGRDITELKSAGTKKKKRAKKKRKA